LLQEHGDEGEAIITSQQIAARVTLHMHQAHASFSLAESIWQRRGPNAGDEQVLILRNLA
jgi:hypothetical protein